MLENNEWKVMHSGSAATELSKNADLYTKWHESYVTTTYHLVRSLLTRQWEVSMRYLLWTGQGAPVFCQPCTYGFVFSQTKK